MSLLEEIKSRVEGEDTEAKARKAIREKLTIHVESEFFGKPDTFIRAARFDGKNDDVHHVTVFNYDDTIAISALVRLGTPPRYATAMVDQGYAFCMPPSVQVRWVPGQQHKYHVIDTVTLEDGSQYHLYVHEIGNLNDDEYDCWAIKDDDPMDLLSYDPTQHTMTGVRPYAGIEVIKACALN